MKLAGAVVATASSSRKGSVDDSRTTSAATTNSQPPLSRTRSASAITPSTSSTTSSSVARRVKANQMHAAAASQQQQQYAQSYLFTVMVAGPQCCGKTAVCESFVYERQANPVEPYVTSIGLDLLVESCMREFRTFFFFVFLRCPSSSSSTS